MTQPDILTPPTETRAPSTAAIEPVTFRVHGLPVAQPRVKARNVVTHSGRQFTQIYTPSKANLWKAQVSEAYRNAIGTHVLRTGAVLLVLRFFLPRPRAHYGSGRNADVLKAGAPLHHSTKPDLDNLVKAVKDALLGLAWRDDSQVMACVATKYYGCVPGVGICVAGPDRWHEVLEVMTYD